MLTIARLKEVLHYNPETGNFTWLVNKRRAKAGDTAGSIITYGYILIRVDQTRQLAHRLAWFYVHGRWPDGDIDHVNGITSDNRIANLREATRAENLKNAKVSARSSTGVKGVSRCSGKFRATIRFDGRRVHLGLFNSIEEAEAAYKEAAEKHHGQFASHLSR
ncbi:HNH endonuclease [Pseudomonas sp. BN414]|uniref:HNH endonuclease n=1 Tax=Pseudomonas sp. BN414 TaxID=2567888 RepID=UPI00245826A2|nr:HNH endonuclease [Pseudomonas sp. BN414]MDH4566199.1 HNH endonuclease [Pseudomonas sp. BN414]